MIDRQHFSTLRGPRTALICGISGQDGPYLAAHLVSCGYRVMGTSRNGAACNRDGLERLGLLGRVLIERMDPAEYRGTLALLARLRPDEIYNLAGQSSVALSYEQPAETFRSIGTATLNILEVMRVLELPTRLFNAGSGAMFGDTGGLPADESTPPRPSNPYALAKATAYWQVAQYRTLYGLQACTGILFNHESPLRPERFVTQKIVAAACRIAAGAREPLALGDLSVERDWGWAPEFVVAMHAMLQQDTLQDLVLATGVSMPLEAFVAEAFGRLGLDWRRHVVRDERLIRQDEIRFLRADPSRAADGIGWQAESTMVDVARRMVEARLQSERVPSRRAA